MAKEKTRLSVETITHDEAIRNHRLGSENMKIDDSFHTILLASGKWSASTSYRGILGSCN